MEGYQIAEEEGEWKMKGRRSAVGGAMRTRWSNISHLKHLYRVGELLEIYFGPFQHDAFIKDNVCRATF